MRKRARAAKDDTHVKSMPSPSSAAAKMVGRSAVGSSLLRSGLVGFLTWVKDILAA